MPGIGGGNTFGHLSLDDPPSPNNNPVLHSALTETALLTDALWQWQNILSAWQKVAHITPQAFEEAYITLCRAGLSDWAETCLQLEALHQAVTGSKAAPNRLHNLAKTYKRGGSN